MPREAPTEVPHMTAVGVASPKAQGHATTTTETPKSRAKRKGLAFSSFSAPPLDESHESGTPPSRPAAYHDKKTKKATVSMTGVKREATASAYSWTGALASWASRTMRAIWAMADLAPVCVTTQAKAELRLAEAPNTASPRRLAEGRDSPVMADSSTKTSRVADNEAATSASVGTAAPGSTMTTSPGCSSAEATTDTPPWFVTRSRRRSSSSSVSSSRRHSSKLTAAFEGIAKETPSIRMACLGCMRRSAAMAPEARCLALASRNLPKATKNKSMAAVSNMAWSWLPRFTQQSTNDSVEYAKMMDVATVTRTSMP
mmetsp:Transcript_16773/g.50867  ORF Transcript_16773/g.50867 Transcript_16773/m.50867 type:complete len:315 (-) Transcript_16773:114-1058(-)